MRRGLRIHTTILAVMLLLAGGAAWAGEAAAPNATAPEVAAPDWATAAELAKLSYSSEEKGVLATSQLVASGILTELHDAKSGELLARLSWDGKDGKGGMARFELPAGKNAEELRPKSRFRPPENTLKSHNHWAHVTYQSALDDPETAVAKDLLCCSIGGCEPGYCCGAMATNPECDPETCGWVAFPILSCGWIYTGDPYFPYEWVCVVIAVVYQYICY